MIRLKHSEITLTPADVEETRRRMERRRAANAPATMPPRAQGLSLPSTFTARLRRGPMRSRDDSVTSLGNVPILRPHQAMQSSLDDPGDPPRPARESPYEHSETVPNEAASSLLPTGRPLLDPTSVAARLALPLPQGEIQLPFRSAIRHEDSTVLDSTGGTSEIDASSLPKGHLSPPRVGRVRTNSSDPGNDEPSPSSYHFSTDGNINSPIRSQTPIRAQTHRSLQHRELMSSPSQHVQQQEVAMGMTYGQTVGSERATSRSTSQPRPTQGYFDSHQRYRSVAHTPRTEPRPRIAQLLRHGRTMSSSSEPSHQARRRLPNRSDSFTEDVFWNPPGPEPSFHRHNDGAQDSTESSNERYWSPLSSEGMGCKDPIRDPSGRNSSAASTASQPYSFYELPESSRQSSGGKSQLESLVQSQYDGAALSRTFSNQLNKGAYYSIRLPGHRPTSRAPRPHPPPRLPSTSSPDLGTLSRNALSPMPTIPYGRISGAQYSPTSPARLINIADFVGGDQDAAIAFQRDLSSPLELIQERAHAYFDRIPRGEYASSVHSRTVDSRAHHSQQPRETSDRQRRASDSESLRYEPAVATTNPGRSGAQSRARMTFAPIPVPEPYPLEHALPARARISHVPRRPVAVVRANQRSSEDTPALQAQEPPLDRMFFHNPSFLSHTIRPSSSIALRGGDLSISSAPARSSVPHVPRPRDVSNRPHVHSPHPLFLSSDDDPSSSDALTPIQLTEIARRTALHGPRIPQRRTSRQHFLPAMPQSHNTRRAVTPVPAPLHGLPSTMTTLDSARGVTSRRPVARAATRVTRVDAEQENSEQREQREMSREVEAAEWRAGRDGVEDVMEETPPRMGRYERFLYD